MRGLHSDLTSMDVSDEVYADLEVAWSFFDVGSGEMEGERIDDLARNTE